MRIGRIALSIGHCFISPILKGKDFSELLRLQIRRPRGLKAEALHLADRTSEALETITEAEILAKRSEERYWWAELHRLHGVFLAAIGADESQIENSFCEAIRTAKEQKSVSLAKRAEATYAEYHRQKASALDGRGFPITSLVTPSTIRTR
jgi:hypothetical protein